jgi:hypothetical protein
MKSLETCIYEEIAQLDNGMNGIIVFDIDDTLLRVDSSNMKVYKKTDDGEIALTTSQFAKDPDAGRTDKMDLFDFRDMNNPDKVYTSIVKGMPLVKNLRILDSYINAGYDFCFLTARGCENTVQMALSRFLRVRDRATGALRKLGDTFKHALSAAVNDGIKKYNGDTDAEKKANILRSICDKYDKVVFVDDDIKNIRHARSLKIPNLTIIKAWKH